MDYLDRDDQRDATAFLQGILEEHLGLPSGTPILAVSSRRALKAAQQGDTAAWEASGLAGVNSDAANAVAMPSTQDAASAAPMPVRGTLATVLRSGADVSVGTMVLCLKLIFKLPAHDIAGELLLLTQTDSFAGFWQAAVRDIRIPIPIHG